MSKIKKNDDKYPGTIRIISLSGAGCNIINCIPNEEELPLLALDTNVCPLYWMSFDTMLCGRKLCRGLGCGGDMSLGYEAAKETLSDKLNQFYDNEINIFVLGLGGGTGGGMLKFILEELNKIKNEDYNKNKCNIIICTSPLNIENLRKVKADKVLDEITSLSDSIFIFNMGKIGTDYKDGKMPIHLFFKQINQMMGSFIYNLFSLNNESIINAQRKYSNNSKIIEFKDETRYNGYFNQGYPRKKPAKLVFPNKPFHVTMQDKDYEQLKAVANIIKDEKTVLFVGCAKGEEILDFEKMVKGNDFRFYGLDYDKDLVNFARNNQYMFPTKIFIADVLKGMSPLRFKIEKETGRVKFDIVICRNLLIYYDEATAKKIVEDLTYFTDNIIVLGLGDPYHFEMDKENCTMIHGFKYKVEDFDNKILRDLNEKMVFDIEKIHQR